MSSIVVNESGQEFYSVKRERTDQIFNNFEILYRKNPATDQYEGRQFVNSGSRSTNVIAGSQTACSESFSDFKFEQKLTIKSDYIREDSVAGSVIDWFSLWLSNKKNTITFKTTPQDGIDVEIGDIIKPEHSTLNFSNNSFVVSKTVHSRNLMTEDIEAVEIPSGLT